MATDTHAPVAASMSLTVVLQPTGDGEFIGRVIELPGLVVFKEGLSRVEVLAEVERCLTKIPTVDVRRRSECYGLSPEENSKLDALAKQLGKSRPELITEQVRRLISIDPRLIEAIEKAKSKPAQGNE